MVVELQAEAMEAKGWCSTCCSTGAAVRCLALPFGSGLRRVCREIPMRDTRPSLNSPAIHRPLSTAQTTHCSDIDIGIDIQTRPLLFGLTL